MKKIVLVLLTFVMLLSLCACGSDDTQTTDGTEGTTEAPTTPPTTQPAVCSHSWNDATCTAPKTCSKCGATEGNAAGHSWNDATCTAPKTCSKCGATEGKAAGHSWNDATCSAPKTCSKCGVTEGGAVGHSWKDATCSAPKTCSKCGATEGKAAGHSWNDATCTAPKTCSKCGVTEGSAAGHSWNDATCTAPKTCSKCGVTEGNAAGHSWNDATCTAPKTCSKCGATEGSAAGHNWQDATYSKPKTCKVCGTTEGSKLSPVIAPGDKTAPELVSFTLNKTNVKVGDVITFTAEIIDSSTIYYAEFQFKCGADWHNVFLDNVGGNIYSGTLKITDTFVSGTYSISWISIQDYAGNTARPSSNASFTVNNPNSTIVIAPGDKTAPELISFTLDKTNVKVGDTITFTAEIKDSSTIDYAEFQFKCGADWHNVFLDNVGGNTYSGTLKITDTFVSGTYSISWISIQDYAGNTARPSSNASFTVNNPNSTIVIAPGDKTAPELISFTLDKTNVKVGDTITFTAEIKDSSTIDYAEFQFKCGADWHNVFLDNVGGNIYSGTLKITDTFVSGTYSISWISIQDYAGNTARPSSNASFTVTK